MEVPCIFCLQRNISPFTRELNRIFIFPSAWLNFTQASPALGSWPTLPLSTYFRKLVIVNSFALHFRYFKSFKKVPVNFTPRTVFLSDLGDNLLKCNQGRLDPCLPVSVGEQEPNFGGNFDSSCTSISCCKNTRKLTFPLGKTS